MHLKEFLTRRDSLVHTCRKWKTSLRGFDINIPFFTPKSCVKKKNSGLLPYCIERRRDLATYSTFWFQTLKCNTFLVRVRLSLYCLSLFSLFPFSLRGHRLSCPPHNSTLHFSSKYWRTLLVIGTFPVDHASRTAYIISFSDQFERTWDCPGTSFTVSPRNLWP